MEETPMSDTILELENVVGGYGHITILNGASFKVKRRFVEKKYKDALDALYASGGGGD